MLIEVQELHPAPAGKKLASVVAAGGTKLGCWPEMLNNFQVGRRYEVETSERTFNGRVYLSITKATPCAETNGAFTARASARTNGDGFDAKGEQIFVVALLKSLIEAGEVKNDKRQLWEATNMLRGLWRASFGAETCQRE